MGNIGTFKVNPTDGWVLLSDAIGTTLTAGTTYQWQSQGNNFFRLLPNATLPTNEDNGLIIPPMEKFNFTPLDGENLYIRVDNESAIFIIIS